LRYNENVNTDPNSWLNSEASHNSSPDQSQLDKTRYSLTIEEAVQLFHEGGVPRSLTTVTRFCRLGDLDCMRIDTERNFKWLVERSSVEKKVKQLQQAVQFASRLQPNITSYNQSVDQSQPDITSQEKIGRETEQQSEEMSWLQERIEELEDENVQLKIDKQAREQIINQMNGERKEFIKDIKDMSFQLGEAQTRLQLLNAPQPQAHHVETAPESQVSDAVEVPSEPTPAPTPPPAPPVTATEPAKPGFLGRLFGR
jgi:hypothetical protein